MSRQTLPVDSVCQHIRMEEHFSRSRGELRITYVCLHPEQEGCWCVLNGASVAECEHGQEGEGVKTVRL